MATTAVAAQVAAVRAANAETVTALWIRMRFFPPNDWLVTFAEAALPETLALHIHAE
jgi:hypothetical protein